MPGSQRSLLKRKNNNKRKKRGELKGEEGDRGEEERPADKASLRSSFSLV